MNGYETLLIPSKQFGVYDRLYRRYLLEPHPVEASRAGLAGFIQPTTNADELLVGLAPQTALVDLNAPGAGVATPFFTVPADRRWRIKAFHREATTASSAVYLSIGGVAYTMTISQGAAERELNINWLLLRADAIGMIATGNAGDVSRRLTILVEEEDEF